VGLGLFPNAGALGEKVVDDRHGVASRAKKGVGVCG
jgi:hypothetical protein